MQYKGRPIERYTGTVMIVREGDGEQLEVIPIKVQQLSVGWSEECERMLPPPAAPVDGVEYDREGRKKPRYNYEDPGYKRELRTWQQRTWAKKIVDAHIDEDVRFETPRELLDEDPRAYYDAVYAELSASFTDGEINRWLFTINSIDQVGGADVALAEEGLFQEVLRLAGLQKVEEDKAAG